MATEVTIAREGRAKPLNSTGRSRARKVPKSDRGFYDDSFVTVYNDKGKVVERGIWDDSVYRNERITWNDRDGNYDLRNGYKLVLKNN